MLGKRRLSGTVWAAILLANLVSGCRQVSPVMAAEGAFYTNVIVADVPWSIHVVKVPRSSRAFDIQAPHAGAGALGMSTLSDQIAAMDPARGTPIAGINGGFYQRANAYAGAPRGVQITGGEVLAAPDGSVALWTDALGEIHLGNVRSQFEVTWPDGSASPFTLNGERPTNGLALYTPAVGRSTHAAGGLELVLERSGNGRWLPLRAGRDYAAQVREIRQTGDTLLDADTLVMSLHPRAAKRYPGVKVGDTLRISTASQPRLLGARAALSGGPVLVRGGKRQRIRASQEDPYEFSSMLERHPRTAIGWNAEWLFLVVVDGRQRDVSDGMTLDELAKFLVKLGCEEALNLDGGGSSTLWFEGEVRNSPCDGYERTIANSLVVLRKGKGDGTKP